MTEQPTAKQDRVQAPSRFLPTAALAMRWHRLQRPLTCLTWPCPRLQPPHREHVSSRPTDKQDEAGRELGKARRTCRCWTRLYRQDCA
ncbi:hypothetical protein EYF80_013947 [Liparis tanakae]|uniref:Uncharacterized protein n=1 Tax=Liparis tanakae TaxID=230148 RepID=A0A4Z2ICX2_9TELE|nr:hypothetical protein EYF80_013947 [Liparis tanakae]